MTSETTTQHVALNSIQIKDWLSSYGNLPKVQTYLSNGQPPWGVIVSVQQTSDVYDDFLLYIPENPTGVWNPANLHVILVTGNPIVESVNKAPYVPPDDVGFWKTFQNQLDHTLKSISEIGQWVVIGLVAYAAIQLIRK